MQWVRAVAWLNLVGNIVIIATGGAVRLTGSGLGCSTWPRCTDESWVPTADEGLHGIIEFGNRLMSPLLGILSILAVLVVWRLHGMLRRAWLLLAGTLVAAALGVVAALLGAPGWLVLGLYAVAAIALLVVGVWSFVAMVRVWREPATRRDLWSHAWILVGGILAQALIGGIVVLTHLSTSTVGIHYLVSAALVGVASSFVLRAYREPGPRERAVPRWLAITTHVGTLLLLVVIVIGVLTTQNGPHSGDRDILRNQDAWELPSHLHAWASYALVAVLVVMLVGALLARARRYTVWVVAVIATVVVQIVVGILQARLGLPPLMVGVHMVLAGVTVAVTVPLVDAVKRPAVAGQPSQAD